MNISWRHITLCVALVMALSAMGQGVPTWERTTHDFGKVRDEEKTLTTHIKVVNTGDSALMITRVQSNCGCTVADYTHELMQPGDTGMVTIRYSTRNIPGAFEKKVWVYTNGNPRKSTLTVKGSVIGSPETVADHYPYGFGPIRLNSVNLPLGEVLKGSARSAYISGYNSGEHTWHLRADTHSPYLSCNVMPDSVAPGDIFIASVYCNAGKAPLWGFNTDSVMLEAYNPTTGTTLHGSFQVMLQVREDFSKLSEKQLRQAPAIEVSTDKIDFQVAAPNEPVQRTFTITNRGKDKLHVRRLFVPEGEGISAACNVGTLKKGQTGTVTVTLNAPQRHDSVVNTNLTIITNDPHSPQTVVRIVGIVK